MCGAYNDLVDVAVGRVGQDGKIGEPAERTPDKLKRDESATLSRTNSCEI